MRLLMLYGGLLFVVVAFTACQRREAPSNEAAPASTNAATSSESNEASNAPAESKPAPAATETNTETKPAGETVQPQSGTNEVAVIDTTDGEMVVGFWPDVAPNTVANFKKLAREKFYDGTCFHRIVKGFMIQGGDPLTKDPSQEAKWGTGGPGYHIKAEFNNRHHEKGVISMARGPDPDSAGSQFFICLADAGSLDHHYTAFGKLIKGMDVLEKIGDTPTTINPAMGEKSKPTVRVEVKSIRIVPANSVK